MINQRYAAILHDKIAPTKAQANWLFTLLDTLDDDGVVLSDRALAALISAQNSYNEILTLAMEMDRIPTLSMKRFEQ